MSPVVRGRGPRARRGAALPVAIVLLAVGGALAIGAAAAMRESTRASRGPIAALRARASATSALVQTMRRWKPEWATTLPIGGARRVATTTQAGDAAVMVLRLDTARYLLSADARARTGAPGAQASAGRGIGVFAQLRRVTVPDLAALTTAGPVAAPAGVRIDGADAPPDGWPACPSGAGVTDLAVARPEDSASVRLDALVHHAVVVTSAAGDDATYSEFGDVRWDALTRRADVVVSAGSVVSPLPRADASGCMRAVDAWGEPQRGPGSVTACHDAYPVVHLRGAGTTLLRGPARMQGVLLVDGDLEVTGDVEIAGVVVVQGALRASGAALRVTGALLVRQRAPSASGANAVALGAGSIVRASRCAVATVTLAASRPMALGRRAWVDVTP